MKEKTNNIQKKLVEKYYLKCRLCNKEFTGDKASQVLSYYEIHFKTQQKEEK